MAWAGGNGGKCQMATGTYIGDGLVVYAITGLGFRPKYVIIWADAANGITIAEYIKSDTMVGDLCIYHESAVSRMEDNHIISLDADGFTVDDDGSNMHPNTNGQLYHYVAWGNV